MPAKLNKALIVDALTGHVPFGAPFEQRGGELFAKFDTIQIEGKSVLFKYAGKVVAEVPLSSAPLPTGTTVYVTALDASMHVGFD